MAWEVEENVRCVVCPGCAFTFDAAHTDVPDGGYSCPNCGYGQEGCRHEIQGNEQGYWRCVECGKWLERLEGER